MLLDLGASQVDATIYVCKLVKAENQISLWEVYGKCALCQLAKSEGLNVEGLSVLNLRFLSPDGLPWEFSRARDRQLARGKQKRDQPDWFVGAPPCGPFSVWKFNFDYKQDCFC